RATRLLMGRLVPAMTRLVTGSHEAKVLMDFYWETVEQSARPETIQRTMREVGFTALEHRVVSPVCEYVARKPARQAPGGWARRRGPARGGSVAGRGRGGAGGRQPGRRVSRAGRGGARGHLGPGRRDRRRHARELHLGGGGGGGGAGRRHRLRLRARAGDDHA